ncbi:sporulation protein [Bacillus atrophaeus]|uniref:sporulation protein n=1 Tax=Bacillus atrophaeus TaxID=1452 RepID=UPI002E24FB24|nr:sporulation protein [Bacillus atrophaeus]
MSFFKKLAASAGIGAAKVDTVLHKSNYSPGEMVRGTVRVKGGSIEQQISHIEVIVKTKYNIQEDDKAETKYKTVASHRVTNEFMIGAGEEKVFSFSCRLPLDTPVTIGKTKVFLMTDLDIEGGIDKSDYDSFHVNLHPWMNNVLQALQEIGFRLHEADCEHAPYFRRRLPFVQEFEFIPHSGPYKGLLDELEAVFHLHEDGLELILEADRKARGLAGWLEEMYNDGERLTEVYFSENELEAGTDRLVDRLDQLISRYAE